MVRRVLLLVMICWTTAAVAQIVAPATRPLATVDRASQHVVLSWQPTTTLTAAGYHICSGTPCLDYDTVFGRENHSYVCYDHDAALPHRYRIHVFDSNYNVSALTPYFGNVALEGSLDHCASQVEVRWSPYDNMPDGLSHYDLLLSSDGHHFRSLRRFEANAERQYSFVVDDTVSRLWLLVAAVGNNSTLRSESNILSLVRMVPDSMLRASLAAVIYDSLAYRATLTFSYSGDTAIGYTLWRRQVGTPWRDVAMLRYPQPQWDDNDVNPYGDTLCYRLTIPDACGRGRYYGETWCLALPDPATPQVLFPTALLAGDADNGIFLPAVKGRRGNLYELQVFDRYGLLVFATRNPTEAWQPDSAVPQGVYTYRLRLRFNDNRIETFVGTVLLLH